MPELPEVTRTAEELHRALAGKCFIEIWISDRAKHTKVDTIPRFTQVTSVDSYGKRIIFNLYHSSVGHFRMCSFLGMEGHWGWDPKVSHLQLKITLGSVATSPVTASSSVKFKFYKRDIVPLCFDDNQYFGFNKVCYTDEEYDEVFKKIGYDLLKDRDKITPEWWLSQIRNRRLSKTKQIVSYLLEQHRFSGVGNYLKSEILYRAGIYPGRILSDLTDEEVELLRVVTLKTVEESYLAGGLTISSFYTPDGKPGKFEKVVYRQDKDPHGYNVIKEVFKDDRSTYWVKEIQK